ncbi:Vesicle-fusing ATPase [Geodia barretti]|uniref:Vesicle-fusing ATPase n=1 Tax=Geodia barretti TaxID=519541 RepID=A0AA35ST04_GEOBA|nr:Vesicle-fusing ATPase [Geodia barretti]
MFLQPMDTDALAREFRESLANNVFVKNQQLVLGGWEQLPQLKKSPLKATVLKIKLASVSAEGAAKDTSSDYGILYENSLIIFERKKDSSIQLTGRAVGDSARTSIISPDWDFKQMGIGGLDKEFSDIFRRAFASRVFPPDVVEQLGMKHVRGILLYGPPGTGKTLMARQIGKMLHAREPKIVNGPEVLNKYVGESESNIRLLFAEAETEQKKMGINSALHIIIFDELDAICKQRGTVGGGTGVHDTVVNQLLAKIDGVEQLNNILLIGMTNRKDLIDDALLRPGRLEVQMEISLPSEKGRLEILHIHTALMRKNKKLHSEVDLKHLAEKTRNFSGAEIEGLVRSAVATAMNRMINASDKVLVGRNDAEKLIVTNADFEHGLQFDVKPAFGISEEQLDRYVFNGIIPWGDNVGEIEEMGRTAIQQIRTSVRTPLVSLLLRGDPGCGKTALAASIARDSNFPFIKILTP